MSTLIAGRRAVRTALCILAAGTILTGPIAKRTLSQQKISAQPITPKLAPEEIRVRHDWHLSMAQTPLPKKGCFEATYPERTWRETTCLPTRNLPAVPVIPRHRPRPLVIGNNNDVSAQVPSGFISTAIGTFQSVTGVTSESGPIANTGPAVANAYTLQINTNTFSSTACAGSPNPACQGWQQFVFQNDGGSSTQATGYIQYWLLNYNKNCPAGQSWNQIQLYGTSDIYCYKNNSGGAAHIPMQPISNLAQLSLTGTVSSTGDSVTISDGTHVSAKSGDNAVAASAGWNIAEFGIFGDLGNSSGGGMASFNSGSTIVPKTRVLYGGTAAPTCLSGGYTGETNNLSFGPTAPTVAAPGPALGFTMSSAGGAPTNCAAAAGIGDTHLRTFGGLFYDFQATGDFVLAQTDNFAVHTRQVSGAPTWPNASTNRAVAAQMGKDRIAVCTQPTRLNVNGENIQIGDSAYSTPGGVDIWRRGNTYTLTDANGNSVQATVNANSSQSWIDVNVGLGRWPTQVTGLLANAGGGVQQIAARDGSLLTGQFAFADLYRRVGESWRTANEDSPLSLCGQRTVENAIPSTAFYAKDLARDIYDRTRAVCTNAGVKGETLLDACTLDVAVLGTDDAAKVYVGMPEPIATALVTGSDSGQSGGYLKWLLWIVIALVILWIILLLKRKKP